MRALDGSGISRRQASGAFLSCALWRCAVLACAV